MLDCSSPRACPSCWHFRAGQCALVEQLEHLAPRVAAPAGPLLRLAAA